MISRKKALIGAIILVLITGALTFTVSNIIQIQVDDKVIVDRQKLELWKNSYEEHSKVYALEDYIKENFLNEITEKELLDGQLKGMFNSLEDPYSMYMTKDEFDSFMDHTKGTYGGIGIIVTPGDDNLITIVSPIEDTPGERSGMKTGDKIVKVNGKEVTANEMDDAIKIMKGKPGTDVTITIKREVKEETKFITMDITREEIRLISVRSNMLDNKIGYIRIIQFDEPVYEDFKKHLTKLQDKGMKGLVIDLRNNPGGLLDKCAEITDKLIGKSNIVYTETKKGEREYLKSDEDKLDIPLVILVNGGSASASEILSGAVKDTNSGTLIGTKTFGKGIVQRIKKLSDGSGFKITVSKYFTPSGKSIHGVGIEPDIEVKLPEDIEQIGVDNIKEDTQLKKAIDVIKNKLK
ncbi:MAG: S41 family peptidase [Firmicutes bacterium]|nr:S41 family peptidase [Bacillota bacterium]